MNIILFEAAELDAPLPLSDPRARHAVNVLRLHEGGSFDAGLIDGPRGKATIARMTGEALDLSFAFEETLPPPLDPITLVIGTPRPIMARRVILTAASLGVQAMHFVTADKGEASYSQSSLWTGDEWRQQLVLGAQQAFDTRLPQLTHGRPLQDAIAGLPPATTRLALDNYEATASLADVTLAAPVVLALGPERGWSERERGLLRDAGFAVAHLGSRVLKLETACIASVMLVKARLGLL